MVEYVCVMQPAAPIWEPMPLLLLGYSWLAFRTGEN
jgi:hypothetical protein